MSQSFCAELTAFAAEVRDRDRSIAELKAELGAQARQRLPTVPTSPADESSTLSSWQVVPEGIANFVDQSFRSVSVFHEGLVAQIRDEATGRSRTAGSAQTAASAERPEPGGTRSGTTHANVGASGDTGEDYDAQDLPPRREAALTATPR